ncbi:MAG: flagellar biosynthetic protein FliR [Candidatus Tokpelaia sp. JSC188]|nr:MAG: flagellar biosynthetic protein FliR [Candidatus Tokpelaia sp. JSC188]
MLGFSIPLDQLVVIAMLVFCRVGTCLMLMPGMSSARVPMRVRLFLAIALSLAILPFVEFQLQNIAAHMNLAKILLFILSELLIGLLFGFLAQAFFFALQVMSNVVAMSMGYSGQPGIGMVETTPEAPLANLVMLGALVIFFITNMHLMLLRGLIASYDAMPLSLTIRPQEALVDVVDVLSSVSLTEIHIAAPFLIYAILVNFTIGLINKLTPTIPVYFISMPFIVFGGLFLLFFLFPEMLHFFSTELEIRIKEIF